MKYEDASWHYDSTPEGPDDQRWEAASAHIGVYLKWCILRGWAGELHTSDEFGQKAILAVKSGESSGAKFLIDQCDGKFTDEDLIEEGNQFTSYYMEASFIDDVCSIAGDQLMRVPESKYDFGALSQVFEQRHKSWESGERQEEQVPKPWWKLW